MAQSSSSSYLEPDDNTIKQWFAQLQEFKSNGTFCDITLKAGSKEIQAHRLILAMSIPFFSGMLQNNYKENRKKKVEIKEVDPTALDSLVNLSYGVELEINHQNAAKLLKAADYLHLDYVKKSCGDFLKTHLTPENVLETKKIAEKFYCSDLVSAAEKLIDNNFPEFAKTEEFLELEKHELIEIIKRDDLKVKEEEVYQAVMKWIKYEGPERIEQLPEVLSYVRLCLLSPEFLYSTVSKESLIKASPECRDLLDEARDYHMMPCSRHLLTKTIRSQYRKISCKIYILGGKNSNVLSSNLQIYDTREERWIIKDCAEKIKASGSAVFEGKIYIFGGHSTSNLRSSETRIFDLNTGVIGQGRNMNLSIDLTAAAVLGDNIYVSGGRDDNTGALNFHQRYSPKLNTWTELAPLNQKRGGHGMVALNGQIYVIGGWSNAALNSCERYDPLTNIWSFIKPMTSSRDCPGVAVLNGKIFVCGGRTGSNALNSVEVYDPIQDVWTQAALMNTKRMGHALVSLARKLYAIGGKEIKSSCLSSCEVYDSETDSWSFVAPLIVPASFVSFGVSSN